jgi:hypothetical protein
MYQKTHADVNLNESYDICESLLKTSKQFDGGNII